MAGMVGVTRWLWAIACAFMSLWPAATSCAAERLVLKTSDVVTFAGGTNMVRMQQAGFLETRLTAAFADRRPRFRDLAWEADTVKRLGTVIERWRPDGFGGRDEQFRRVGTTVVIAQFGQTEALARASSPESKAAVAEFARAYDELVAAWQKQARLVVLVTPARFEKPLNPLVPDLSRHNEYLAEFVRATHELARRRGALFVDLFSARHPRWTNNGMHIRPAAQRDVAELVADRLGVAKLADRDMSRLRPAVLEKHRLWYDYWRPANWKLLYGDDSRRVFTRGGETSVPFRYEWKQLLPRVAEAETRVLAVAEGKQDPGYNRPKPETLHKAPEANVKNELASFEMPAGFAVNLFASEAQGLTSPIAMRWDPAGRMYVAVTTTYPHVFPGDLPNDKIIRLEDTDGDGDADRSVVFAEGLNIPTGIEWGDGGVYVGQNTEILFLKDTDGDGRADVRQVLLGGFGNGDSHQTINSFVWSPGGELYFGQGDGCESRVETPWGPSHLFQAGFYRFRPRRLQLDPLLDDLMGPGNPWGVAFDEWGQIFSIDGAGGVTYLSPGQVPTTHKLKLRRIGNPGGYCGIGFLDGRGVPAAYRGSFVIGDFKPNRVKRFAVKPDGAGYSLDWHPPILQSRHRNFRPVDVKQGPDGAIYVVDWYNPITCHQDDAYRDPRRDKAHGRIWRLVHTEAAKEVPRPKNLSKATLPAVLQGLLSPEHWTRYQAKRELTTRDPQAASRAIDRWVVTLDPKDPRHEHHLHEALGAYATLEVVRPGLLDRLLEARDHRARAYAARVTGRWHDRLDHPLQRLAARVVDPHPQVRMEAVMACAAIPDARSIEIAARVVDLPKDGWIDYAFKQTVHHLRPHWQPEFLAGHLSFQRPVHLASVLNEVGGRDTVASLKKLLGNETLDRSTRAAAIAAILAVAEPADVRTYGLEPRTFTFDGRYDAALHGESLSQLVAVSRFRNARPDGEWKQRLGALLNSDEISVKKPAVQLVGAWKVVGLGDAVATMAGDRDLPVPVRAACFESIVAMGLKNRRDLLQRAAADDETKAVRAAAVTALVRLDKPLAAKLGAELLVSARLSDADTQVVMRRFAGEQGGASSLATALATRKLDQAVARRLLKAMFATGRSERAMLKVLNRALGAAAQPPAYSPAIVKRLVDQSAQRGKQQQGRVLFGSLGCVSCHRVGGRGGRVGPDLTAIGTTLSASRIAEELLWPNRQVKEGFTVLQVVTDDGKVHQGYPRKTRASQQTGDLVLEDPATGQRTTIKKQTIELQKPAGSLMPEGLTAVLSPQQISDLLAYLTQLGEIRRSEQSLDR